MSGQSLIILLTDSKVKSTKLKARFQTLVITFKQEGASQQPPQFISTNEWSGDLREQKLSDVKLPIGRVKYAQLYLKPKEDHFDEFKDNEKLEIFRQHFELFVYLGYGSDCTVFKPTFDAEFNRFLVDMNSLEEAFARKYEQDLLT